jgi:CMP-N-acetylneuraminic acid synthetase
LNVIAIVPARYGSKRFPDKNIQPFVSSGGRDYNLTDMELAYAASMPVGAILLTTNYIQDYFPMSRKLRGKKFIYRERPTALCMDDVPMWKVVDDALGIYFQQFDQYPDAFVLLQPTSPLRENTTFVQARDLVDAGAKAVVTFNPALKPNGNLYLMDTIRFKETHSFFPEGLWPIVQDWKHSVDIDNEQDFRAAQHIFRNDEEFKNMRW